MPNTALTAPGKKWRKTKREAHGKNATGSRSRNKMKKKKLRDKTKKRLKAETK